MPLPNLIDLFEGAINGQVFDPNRFNIDQKTIQDTINVIINDLIRHYGTDGNDHDLRYYLKEYIDATFATKGEVSGVVLGQIPPGTITDDSLSNANGQIKSKVTTLEGDISNLYLVALMKSGGTITGPVAHGRNDVRQPNIEDYSETLTTITGASGTVNINLASGNNFDVDVSGATTLNVQNLPTDVNIAYSFTISLTQPATAQAITYPAIVKWPNDTPPTLDANKTHILTFIKFKNASRLFGMASTKFTP